MQYITRPWNRLTDTVHAKKFCFNWNLLVLFLLTDGNDAYRNQSLAPHKFSLQVFIVQKLQIFCTV